jgi:hypothetical protein
MTCAIHFKAVVRKLRLHYPDNRKPSLTVLGEDPYLPD